MVYIKLYHCTCLCSFIPPALCLFVPLPLCAHLYSLCLPTHLYHPCCTTLSVFLLLGLVHTLCQAHFHLCSFALMLVWVGLGLSCTCLCSCMLICASCLGEVGAGGGVWLKEVKHDCGCGLRCSSWISTWAVNHDVYINDKICPNNPKSITDGLRSLMLSSP